MNNNGVVHGFTNCTRYVTICQVMKNISIKEMPEVMSPQYIADLFGVSRRTVYRWMVKSKPPLPYIKVGGNVRILRDSFNSWVDFNNN